MDDAGRVRRDERARHLPDADSTVTVSGCAVSMSVRSVTPVDQFLDDVELAAGGLADFVDGDDVGVVEGGGGPGLPEEPLDDVGCSVSPSGASA